MVKPYDFSAAGSDVESGQLHFLSNRTRDKTLHDQLYRYADDLQRLMARQSQLEADNATLREALFELQVAQIAFRHIDDAVMVTDIEGEILAVNPAFCRITGYAETEVLGHRASVLRSGLHHRDFYAALWRSLAENGTWQGRIDNRRKNGEIYAQWLIINAARDEQGRTLCYVAVFREMGDTSANLEQRVAERTRELEASRQAAQQAERLLREAVENVAVGFTIYDPSDRLVVCNEAYRRIYESSRDLIVPGATFEEIVRRGAERGQYRDAIGNIDAWVAERVAQHQNPRGEILEQSLGDGRWVMIVEYRTPSGYTVGNRIDISELKRTSESLRERTAQLDAIFDLSPDGFVSFDSRHRVKYASPAFFRLTGLDPASITGCDEAVFSAQLAAICGPRLGFAGVASLREAEKVDADGTATNSRPRRFIELTGPAKRVLEVGLRLGAAETVSQILYFRDVTRETEVDRMKDEFLSHAAHELRTPMATIYGFAELMLAEEFPPGQRRELIDIIFRQSELVVSIINEMLDLSRIESRRGMDFQLVALDAAELVREAAASFKPPPGRAAPLPPSCPAGPTIKVDRKKILQAIGNLLSNAYKYSPAGGAVALEWTLQPATAEAAAMVGIVVVDHGVGMTPEQTARACERFYRVDTSGKTPGTGLGLSIVKEIIQLHGGHLALDSTPGAGTRVSLWLPVEKNEGKS